MVSYPRKIKSSGGNYYNKWKRDPERWNPTEEDVWCELQLQVLGDFEPLNFDIDQDKFKEEMEPYKNSWVPYLQREGVQNNREGLLLVGLDGDSPTDSLSMPEAIARTGKFLHELDFDTPTQLYKDLTCLHSLLDYWEGLGRTMLVKVNQGGFFPPHRDDPHLTRNCFRVVAFIGSSTNADSYEWILDDRKRNIVAGNTYYIDTRKTHRTHSWEDDSIHLILNIPKTWANIQKLMSKLKYS